MREPSEFQEADDESEHPRACWIWMYEYEDEDGDSASAGLRREVSLCAGNSQENKFYADVGDSVRFRVHAVLPSYHRRIGCCCPLSAATSTCGIECCCNLLHCLDGHFALS